ncbi:MAG TPA: carbohydrate kinase family protein [Spirochaetia bacterium]|nr:carbohydrate kinase family protein [Spirochaetia bacterium]
MSTLFAGDGNVDLQLTGLASLPQTDREVTCSGFAEALGGSTTICAAAYALLGGDCAYAGLLGDDHYGHFVKDALGEAGVHLDLVRTTSECPTGVTVNLVYRSTRTQVTFPGTLAILDETDSVLRELGRFSHLHLAGPYPLLRFLPRVREVLAAARSAGLSTSMTTQWDPRQEWEGLPEWLPLLSVLFVNEEEALSITARRTVEEAWKDLAARTACPLITRGGSGAYADGRSFEALQVAVVDPTGAGDTFAAAFLWAKNDKGMALPDAVRYACAAGALACTYTGGVNRLLSHARVRELIQ